MIKLQPEGMSHCLDLKQEAAATTHRQVLLLLLEQEHL